MRRQVLEQLLKLRGRIDKIEDVVDRLDRHLKPYGDGADGPFGDRAHRRGRRL